MKNSKLIISILAGVALASVTAILIRKKFSNNDNNNDLMNRNEHGRDLATTHLRKAMDKANHLKQEHAH